jgi:hypothetical protein
MICTMFTDAYTAVVSGRRWLIDQHKITPGKFLVPFASDINNFRGLGISPVTYKTNLKAYKTFFMYDFSSQYYVSFQDVIDLDKEGCDVYIAGTRTVPLPKYFLDYIIQNYPETMI